MSSHSPSELDALRKQIDSHLRSQNVYGQIRDFIKQSVAQNTPAEAKKLDDGSGAPMAPDSHQIVSTLHEKGVLEQLLHTVTRPRNIADGSGHGHSTVPGSSPGALTHPPPPTPSPYRRFLHVKLNGGRAFVDHAGSASGSFVVLVHFRNQRFRSRPVQCSIEPAFDESFLIDLQPPDQETLADLATLLSITSKVHLVLLHEQEGEAGEKSMELVASYDLDWRKALAEGTHSLPAELIGSGARAKLRHSVGILDLQLDVVPAPVTDIPPEDILRGIDASQQRDKDMHRQFFQYSRVWWKEYVEIDPTFKDRLVKIFAEDEWGGHRPVCSFVIPLSGGRLIDSPRHAARFVSLIPYTKSEAVGAGGGSGRAEIWHHFHTFLSLRKGDCEDHAVLLCSLLLGFGMDAYVCIGSVGSTDAGERPRPHAWVITRSRRGSQAGSRPRVVIWESLTGQRYPHQLLTSSDGVNQGQSASPEAMPAYHSIACAFNDRHFHANKQLVDSVADCNFNFEDSRCWKSMDKDILSGLEHQEAVPLCPPTMNTITTETALEQALRHLVTSLRRNELRLSTTWDERLSYMLSPALSSYEMERLTGAPYGSDEFQQSIRQNVAEGFTFRGYPIVVNDQSPTRILSMFRRAQIATDILRTRGDSVRFALRVKCVCYPEDVCATWVMLAVKFKHS